MITLDEEKNVYLFNGREYPRFSHIMQEVGEIDVRWYNEFYALRGRYVHEATVFHDTGVLNMDALDPELRPFVEGWIKFRREVPTQIVYIEKPLVHSALGYGCTLDRVLLLNGKIGVWDIKCTKTKPTYVGQQTIAHKLAFNFSQMFDEKIKDRFCLQLPGDGNYRIHPLKDEGDLPAWMRTLSTYSKMRGQQ